MWRPVNVTLCAAPNLRDNPENPMNPDKAAVHIEKCESRRLHEYTAGGEDETNRRIFTAMQGGYI